MSEQSYTYASPRLGVAGASGLLCFRSLSLHRQIDYGNSAPCCSKGIRINTMFQIVFTSRSTELCVRRALGTFRLKYAGGNAERMSFHPSPT